MYKRTHKVRIFLSVSVLILTLAALCLRLFYIQIGKSGYYSKLAADQHRLTIQIQPQRGTLYSRNMKELAISGQAFSVYAVSKNISEKSDVARSLAPVLELDKEWLLAKLNRNRSFVWLSRKVSDEAAEEVKKLDIKGIELLEEPKRFYPGRELASQVVGFCGVDNQGLEGLEFYYDKYLMGLPGWRRISRDGVGREIVVLEAAGTLPLDGYDIILTLDEIIQHVAEDALRSAVKRWRAKGGTVIVMDPRDGSILAMANYPAFDPNLIASADPAAWRNKAITDCFEPGSSFKIVTASAALEEGVVELEDEFYCEEGAYHVGGRILHDYLPKGWLNFKEVMAVSSNIGTVKVAERLGERRLWDYCRSFGFGEKTLVDLPGEGAGIIKEHYQWSRTSISSIPMGQEVACTAIQLASAISCIANDGVLMKPRVVDSIRNRNGEVIKSFPPVAVRRVISTETASQMKEILTTVIEEGTGKLAKIEGVEVAGKTGTAQKARRDGRGYSDNDFVSSFVGFVPVERPILSIVAIIDEPRQEHFGSVVSAPVFREVAIGALRYLETKD